VVAREFPVRYDAPNVYSAMTTQATILAAELRLKLSEPPQVVSAGRGLRALLGFDPEEFLSSRISLRGLIHPHDDDVAQLLFRPEPLGRGTCNLRLRCADDRIRCVVAVYTRTPDPVSGEPVLDLEFRDAMSASGYAASQSAEVKFQAIIDNSDDVIFFKDRNHVFTAASRTMKELAAPMLKGRELIGLTDYEVLGEEEADAFYRMEKQVFAGGGMVCKVQRVTLAEGKEQWVVARKFPLRNGNEEIVGLFAISQDITARVKAEAALRESKELLQIFIEHAPVALAMYDREMRVLAFSRRWLEDYGVKDGEVIGRPHYELVPDIPERWKEDHRRVLAGESLRREEDRFERADGTVRWLRRELLPWRLQSGEIGGIVILSEDVTRAREAEAALRQGREHLRIFIEHAPAALAMFDREMRYMAVSQRWLHDYGMKGRFVVGLSHSEIFPGIPDRWRDVHRRCLEGEAIRCSEERFESADGKAQWVRWEARPWRLVDGSVGGIAIFGEDITQAKADEERLRLAASVFTHAREGIMITGADGAILEVNDTFSRITGYSREEVLGRKPQMLSSGRQEPEFFAEMWRAINESGQWSGEIWNRRKNGEIFAAVETINTVFDAAGKAKCYVAMLSDITPMKEQERKMAHAAHYDALTGLPNRVLLAERLREAMAQTQHEQMLAVAYMDLDDFKSVNDRYGRETGDTLLAAVANRMKLVLREGDTLARLGGDEFVAVMRNLEGTEDSILPLNRLLRAAGEPAQVGDLDLQVSATGGLALYPQSEDVDADQLLRQADRAMCQAKLGGRNRFHIFDSRQDRTVRSHFEDLEQIRRALAAREFVLYYQPKVNMAKGSLIGAEALIRWQHPLRGLLGPNLFLPVIEDHSLAVEVGDWVIDEALGQMESWRAAGLDIPVSVNVCARQLQEPRFIDRLRALLDAHPTISPTRLELEVLETSALWDVAQVSELIGECRRLGVSVALDDFGTGYSSLTYLKRIPANILKIDQSFIRDMLNDPEDMAILEGVLGLATAFRRQAIAEGVETVAHGSMLLQLGCELAQGFGIARPMPAGDLPAWAAAWKPDPHWAFARPVSPSDTPVLYAGVEHRAWFKLLGAYLKGERNAPPALEGMQCRMGTWLVSEARGPRGTQPAFLAIASLHGKLHEMAAEVVALKAAGQTEEGQALFAGLNPLVDETLERLNAFLQQR
jgi:diguanylate cyclase (GGDEF)-like protein/PAS domain S-box-containing protein